MHIWALGQSCETPAAPPDRAAGVRTRQPKNSNGHISGHLRFKHHQNSTQGPQEREKEERKLWWRREKKARNVGPPALRGSPLLGSTLLGSTLLGPTLRGPTFSRFGASTLWAPHPSRAPHLVVPKFNIPKLAEIEIGRSRNWPKSHWPNSKKELAEVEIGRSRSPPFHFVMMIGISKDDEIVGHRRNQIDAD